MRQEGKHCDLYIHLRNIVFVYDSELKRITIAFALVCTTHGSVEAPLLHQYEFELKVLC